MPFTPEAIVAEVRAYLLENHLFSSDQSQLSNDMSLLERGVIDSTGILEVIAFLEGRYAVTVKDNELLPSNFDSVGKIADFVQRLLAK